jgi:hypothetical protein
MVISRRRERTWRQMADDKAAWLAAASHRQGIMSHGTAAWLVLPVSTNDWIQPGINQRGSRPLQEAAHCSMMILQSCREAARYYLLAQVRTRNVVLWERSAARSFRGRNDQRAVAVTVQHRQAHWMSNMGIAPDPPPSAGTDTEVRTSNSAGTMGRESWPRRMEFLAPASNFISLLQVLVM